MVPERASGRPLATLVLVLQIVTGIFLTMHYQPSAEDAFGSAISLAEEAEGREEVEEAAARDRLVARDLRSAAQVLAHHRRRRAQVGEAEAYATVFITPPEAAEEVVVTLTSPVDGQTVAAPAPTFPP